ncbi:hypothetical protein BJ973_005649 [Actinoplanes tereljensis]|uniref:Uncharacterized protein n=1 Tax=Paractinoplanes tereljensis TaxID=571912 RepID=A0A919NW36_9ACTN|nr:hypothetical protein [Actinoplanes tereljensis]GIF26290.1 hypothetical protein Ate02nite_90200 [Actinoplanes tereljensis]
MSRWKAIFWIVVGLNAFTVAVIFYLQVRSGSWSKADQIGGALGFYAAWFILIDTLFIAELWRRAYASPAHIPDASNTPSIEKAGRTGSSIARCFLPTMRRHLNNGYAFAAVAAALLVLYGIVLWDNFAPQAPRPYFGATFMSGEDTLHFGPAEAIFVSTETRRKYSSKSPVAPIWEEFARQAVPDMAVTDQKGPGRGPELWFLMPSAILQSNDGISGKEECKVALEKAAKQTNGAYVTVNLNSDAIVCVSPHQSGIAQVKVHSGPVEFRVAYRFYPLDHELEDRIW